MAFVPHVLNPVGCRRRRPSQSERLVYLKNGSTYHQILRGHPSQSSLQPRRRHILHSFGAMQISRLRDGYRKVSEYGVGVWRFPLKPSLSNIIDETFHLEVRSRGRPCRNRPEQTDPGEST